jgi:hypothetical protein
MSTYINKDMVRPVCLPLSSSSTVISQDIESLLSRYENGNTDNLVCLMNKSPSWNEQTQSYVLNFHGRVTQASVKNFQIVHPDNGKIEPLFAEK